MTDRIGRDLSSPDAGAAPSGLGSSPSAIGERAATVLSPLNLDEPLLTDAVLETSPQRRWWSRKSAGASPVPSPASCGMPGSPRSTSAGPAARRGARSNGSGPPRHHAGACATPSRIGASRRWRVCLRFGERRRACPSSPAAVFGPASRRRRRSPWAPTSPDSRRRCCVPPRHRKRARMTRSPSSSRHCAWPCFAAAPAT